MGNLCSPGSLPRGLRDAQILRLTLKRGETPSALPASPATSPRAGPRVLHGGWDADQLEPARRSEAPGGTNHRLPAARPVECRPRRSAASPEFPSRTPAGGAAGRKSDGPVRVRTKVGAACCPPGGLRNLPGNLCLNFIRQSVGFCHSLW